MEAKLRGSEAVAKALGMSVGNLHVHRRAGNLDGVVSLEDGQLVARQSACDQWRRRWSKRKSRGRPLRSAAQ